MSYITAGWGLQMLINMLVIVNKLVDINLNGNEKIIPPGLLTIKSHIPPTATPPLIHFPLFTLSFYFTKNLTSENVLYEGISSEINFYF